jgi:hypothetical protein
LLEVLAGMKPVAVAEGTTPLPELASAAELETATSGWAFDAAALGGLLMIKLPAGAHTIAIKGPPPGP